MTSISAQPSLLKIGAFSLASVVTIGSGMALMWHSAQLQTEFSTGRSMEIQIQMAMICAALFWLPTFSILPRMTPMTWISIAAIGVWVSAVTSWASIMMHLPS